MRYENTKYKLKKIWTQSGLNEYEISKQEDSLSRLKKSNKASISANFRGIIDLSTEWESLIAPSLDSSTDAWYTDYRIQWNIDLNILDIKLIPFINYNIIYKCINEEELINEDNLVLTYPRTPSIFRIEDLKDDNEDIIPNLKKVTMIVGYLIRPYPFATLESLGKTYDIQAKLLIKLYNPQLFI